MADIIHLLPDSVANQIAAGEVVQRPASAIKELLENAIDAGASEVKVIVKDAGKTLIQVIDNGCGMSETDARLSFERHATSKIRNANDLFEIRTMGFRGEALASIAAIAHVELKTKRFEDELGTQIIIEGSEVVSQENCSCANGTSFSIKNLFYNTPARRKFLKSDNAEISHVFDEFIRVALIHFDIAFTLHSNNKEIYHLEKSNFKQRVVNIFGNNYNQQKILPVEEDTTIAKISGFIGKPEIAKSKRGEQYFFVNKRFIKHAYLNNAVQRAFQDLIPNDKFPSYFINITLDPKSIDINIHPTKTEIKFEDEKTLYSILHSAVKQAIGKFHLAPMLDFEAENTNVIPYFPANRQIVEPTINIDKNYNPFNTETRTESLKNETFSNRTSSQISHNQKNWEKLYSGLEETKNNFSQQIEKQQTLEMTSIDKSSESFANKNIFQIHNKYILAQVKSGLMIIDQQAAHERIIFEKIISNNTEKNAPSQQLLFPKTIELNSADYHLYYDLKEDLHKFGFEISDFGKNAIVVYGIPTDALEEDVEKLIENLFALYNENIAILSNKNENLARSLAKTISIKQGKPLTTLEMQNIIDKLFACSNPNYSPNGKAIVSILNVNEIEDRFKINK